MERKISLIINTLKRYRRLHEALTINLERVYAKPHSLPVPLIVSLTSYPPRYKYLHATIKTLLNQTIKPDLVILWIAANEINLIPVEVKNLKKYGLYIFECENLKSFKKLIPTLRMFPDSLVATADDDIFYSSQWLESLVSYYSPHQQEVICHRAHEIVVNDCMRPKNYLQWNMNITHSKSSKTVFPTSGAGALYKQSLFHEDIFDMDTALNFCATADDIWFYWMSLRKGTTNRKIGPLTEIITWPKTQRGGLHEINVIGGQNDAQVAKLTELFGFEEHL